MMTMVPVSIDKTAIVSLALYDLLFSNFESLFVRVLGLAHIKYLLGSFASERRLAKVVNHNRGSHVLKYDIVSTWHFN